MSTHSKVIAQIDIHRQTDRDTGSDTHTQQKHNPHTYAGGKMM